ARPGVPPARTRSRSRRPPSARACFRSPPLAYALLTAPQYIAIHVRRGDFAGWCPTTRPVDECFAPLSAYARRVEEVREELQRARGIEVQHVVLTSDETNATWWEEVAAYGWHRVDHSTTVETHSRWHPVLIDAAIQSGDMGFVEGSQGGRRQGGGGRPQASRGEPNRVLGAVRG
ncbi:hypothetical protein B0H14DRAFT_2711093, partial [Mycena olivaceomarginata]